MRKIKSFLAPLFALLLTTSVFAGDIHISDATQEELRKEIAQKFEKIDFSSYDLEETTVKVQFLVNDKNELIILRTNHSELDKLIKIKLNYEELETKNVKRNSLYSISVRLV